MHWGGSTSIFVRTWKSSRGSIICLIFPIAFVEKDDFFESSDVLSVIRVINLSLLITLFYTWATPLCVLPGSWGNWYVEHTSKMQWSMHQQPQVSVIRWFITVLKHLICLLAGIESPPGLAEFCFKYLWGQVHVMMKISSSMKSSSFHQSVWQYVASSNTTFPYNFST